jgi:hypothetical protein
MNARADLAQEESTACSERTQQRRQDQIQVVRVDIRHERGNTCLGGLDLFGE